MTCSRRWAHYRREAWGGDELRPLTNGTKNWSTPALGLTLIDALSTLWVLDLKDDFAEGADWVSEFFDARAHAGGKGVDVFETTIRALGGLISAHARGRRPH